MTSNWSTVSLAAVSGKPQYGVIASGSDTPIGPLLVRQTDITSGRVDWSSVPYCDLSSSDIAKYALRQGDLLISRLGNGVGNAATILEARDDAVFAGYLVRFQPDPEVANPVFVGYQLQSNAWRAHVSSFRSGAAQPTLNAQQMGEFEFLLPPLEEQRAIAATLGALDDKIESNRRAVAIALSLALASYEHAALSASRERLGDLATLVLGGTPSRKRPELWENGSIPWIASGAANAEIVLQPTELITQDALAQSAAKMMPKGATVIAITGATLGQVALLGIDTSGNQSLVGVWADKPALTTWLHLALRASVNDLVKSATGAAQQHVNKGNVAELMVPVLDDEELDEWAAVNVPLIEQCVQLEAESQRLTALRDALLPELLSGRIRVSAEGAAA